MKSRPFALALLVLAAICALMLLVGCTAPRAIATTRAITAPIPLVGSAVDALLPPAPVEMPMSAEPSSEEALAIRKSILDALREETRMATN